MRSLHETAAGEPVRTGEPAPQKAGELHSPPTLDLAAGQESPARPAVDLPSTAPPAIDPGAIAECDRAFGLAAADLRAQVESGAGVATSDDVIPPRLNADAPHVSSLIKRLLNRRTGGVAATTLGVTLTAPNVHAAGPHNQQLVSLVNRLNGGYSESEYIIAAGAGFTTYRDNQINYTSIPDPDPVAFVAGDPSGLLTRVETWSAIQLFNSGIQLSPIYVDILKSLTLMRLSFSKRGLYEHMTRFFSDHFSIDSGKAGILKCVDDREVIRANSLGFFPPMLQASAKSAAMLVYLDNWLNKQPMYQENYARELLELHTLGAFNQYDENDVKKVAACLAGWSIETNGTMPNPFEFKYIRSFHDPLPSYSILQGSANFFVPAGHQSQGDLVVNTLAMLPETAGYVGGKMTQYLLGRPPTAAEATSILSSYATNNGDIGELIKTIVTPTGIDTAVDKFKQPVQLATGTIRQLQATWTFTGASGLIDPMLAVREALTKMGNTPFEWGPPNGYPDTEGAWIGAMMQRWDLLDKLLHNQFEGIDISYTTLIGLLGPFTVPTMAQRLNELLTGCRLPASEVNAIQLFINYGLLLLINNTPGISAEMLVRDAFALTLSAPCANYY